MDYMQYISAYNLYEKLKEQERNENVKSASVTGERNKKLALLKKYIDKQDEILLAEISEQIKPE